MKYLSILVLCIALVSCKKKENEKVGIEPSLAKIDIYNNEDINKFVVDFLKNQSEDFDSRINQTKFISNKFEKDSISNLRKPQISSKKILDSLISEEDWKYIEEQINDKKEYFAEQKYFKQKVLNNDSIIKIVKDFRKSQEQLSDLAKKNHDTILGHKMYQNDIDFEQNMLKTRTPILSINKPLFTRSRKIMIFSFGTYFNMLNAKNITAIYKFENGKWKKIADLYIVES